MRYLLLLLKLQLHIEYKWPSVALLDCLLENIVIMYLNPKRINFTEESDALIRCYVDWIGIKSDSAVQSTFLCML